MLNLKANVEGTLICKYTKLHIILTSWCTCTQLRWHHLINHFHLSDAKYILYKVHLVSKQKQKPRIYSCLRFFLITYTTYVHWKFESKLHMSTRAIQPKTISVQSPKIRLPFYIVNHGFWMVLSNFAKSGREGLQKV